MMPTRSSTHPFVRPCWQPILLVLALCMLPAATVLGEAPIEYNRHIRPILMNHCFHCHGPDSAGRKADLRLDLREPATDYGAIVPGDPDSSEAIRRILSEDPDERMPPPNPHKELTEQEKQLLTRWVAEGAEYQEHWSFLRPERSQPPAVGNSDWVNNPIDAFVLARLEQAGLAPAEQADRRTLARRLSLDLTGLPPAPELVQQFVDDPAPDAYEKLVDRLLASKHWGEHRGRYWLDAARYADTHGIHFDNFREIWAYRDWVIAAFNRNLPFDQFTIEQLAGDLLPSPTLEQRIATGFNRCNITTNEGGVIAEEYLVLYTQDRTETVSQVWMGLTANCATCHDHKYDPLSQREYYQMAAFFNNTTQGAMDGNIKDTPPIIPVPQPEDRARWDALGPELAEAEQQLAARKQSARPDFGRWLADITPEMLATLVPSDRLQLHLPLDDQSGEQTSQKEVALPEAGDFENDQAFSYGAWLKLGGTQTGAAVARMDDQNDYRGWDLWIENGRLGAHIIHRWKEDAIKVVSRDPVQVDQWNHVLVTYDGSQQAAGVKLYINGAVQQTQVQANGLKGTIRTDVPLKIGQRHTASPLQGATVQDLRIYDRVLETAEVQQLARNRRALALAGKPADQRTEAETDELYQWWLPVMDPPYQELAAQRDGLQQEQEAIKARGTVAHVTHEKDQPPTAHVLVRGEYDQRGEKVGPRTPEVLPPMDGNAPHNRLGFAQWLLQPEHPLTARVTVNRFWQELFGTGLVATAGDFGTAGEMPSHPELLDWLAIEFRESGWDVKRLFKLLVMSATYQQAGIVTQEKLEKDPDNRLLSRGARYRMDAEMIRDYALAASGLLVPKLGGPSVKPYQPDGVWEAVAMIGSNTRNYQPDSGEKLYRRSLYTFWKRSAPPASLDIFDAPNRESCTVQRERTNTPLQALVTLNDTQFIEAARHLAQIALLQGGQSTEARIEWLALRLLARPLRAEEQDVVHTTLDHLLHYYRQHPEDAAKLVAVGQSQPDPALDASDLAAWTMLANQLLNLDEALNK